MNHTPEAKRKIGNFRKGKKFSEETKIKISQKLKGKNNPMYGRCGSEAPSYKHGYYCGKNFYKTDFYRQKQREKRHRKGISKKFISKYGGQVIPKKYYRQQYRALKKAAGPLTIKTIQQVYEENIKYFGTLTCYLCLKPIQFKEDSLDHIIPLTKNGTNKFENLAIAHIICNIKKGNKLC